jgi:hypothetical protein
VGAHTRPRTQQPGRHRGETAPLIDVDLVSAAGKTGAALVTGAAATTLVVTGAGVAGAAPAHADRAAAAATSGDFAALRGCESGGNYRINTGNGFYGAYQFDLRTWHGLGYGGLPSSASPATQDRAAEQLQAARGWEPWPACSRKLGLGTVSRGTTRGTLKPAPAKAAPVHTVSVHLAGSVPAYQGQVLTAALGSHKRSDVLVWQSRMARRGWHISVDGYFGPQSASIAQQFAAEKNLRSGSAVDAVAWNAAWTAKIT